LTPARIYRACMEGIALNLAAGIGRMRALGIECRELRAVGGGAHNRAFLRILADAAGASVTPLVEAESAALGAALQACWSVGLANGGGQGIDELARAWVLPEGEPIRPDPARVALMAGLRERFAALRTTLYGV
jgi:sugar (pentulose or hexulose) kinase